VCALPVGKNLIQCEIDPLLAMQMGELLLTGDHVLAHDSVVARRDPRVITRMCKRGS
jgi:hypothetical protein